MKQPHRSKKKSARRRAAKPLTTPSPMNPAQIKLLRESFALVEPQAHIAALVFYRNLFELNPSLRPLFHTSIELQGRKLMEALTYTVATLENPEVLVPVLEAMGRRHVAYGAREEHYATVIRAMMFTLEETLGDAFNSELRAAWNQALKLVASIMKRGAAPVTALKRGLMTD